MYTFYIFINTCLYMCVYNYKKIMHIMCNVDIVSYQILIYSLNKYIKYAIPMSVYYLDMGELD